MKCAIITPAIAFGITFGLMIGIIRALEKRADGEEIEDVIQRLEAKIDRLERELKLARLELTRLIEKQGNRRVTPRIPSYLRFPVDVERAMIGDGQLWWPDDRPSGRLQEGSSPKD